MANYTTNVSDKKKGQVLKTWAVGLLGTLGLHFFTVGRVKHGFLRLLYGAFMWAVCIMLARDAELPAFPKVAMFVLLFLPSLVDLVKIQLGVFRDNTGNAVREK